MTTTPETLDVAGVARAGIRIILDHQAPSGAYVASPTFSQYGFGWLRDGAYCALAVAVAGEPGSAERFDAWVSRALLARAARIHAIVDTLRAGGTPDPGRMLPARFELDGSDEPGEEWPNFQLDGYGTWLYSMHRRGRALEGPDREAAELAADYLAAAWRLPCFDYWEESGDRRHTSTLAAIEAGLRAAARLLAHPTYRTEADAVHAEIRRTCIVDGSFVKSPSDSRVDASLISLATPFGLVQPDDPIMARTIGRIRDELASPSGGIRRYLGDTYYGGSPWQLLTAWLGWHDRLDGRESEARSAEEWVVARADANGGLAEQDVSEPQDPGMVEPWVKRWGPVADPLLWSSAKFALLHAGAEATRWS